MVPMMLIWIAVLGGVVYAAVRLAFTDGSEIRPGGTPDSGNPPHTPTGFPRMSGCDIPHRGISQSRRMSR
jgi:hypothetical protein